MDKIIENEKETNFISAVVYVHNNEQEIFSFLKSLKKWMSHRFKNYEIICVNDASTDNTVKSIKNIPGGYLRCEYGCIPRNGTKYECWYGSSNRRFCF